MQVLIGEIHPFPNIKADKAQVMKVCEETMEVFSAWKLVRDGGDGWTNTLLDECADLIQATGNLIAALGVEDFTPYMESCEFRNRERGRYEHQAN